MPRVYISIGSNIERDTNIRSGVAALREHFGDLTLSTVYESKAVGFEGDDFYNLVAGFDTGQGAIAVNGVLRDIEHRHGRVRGGSGFSSRTLDLDMLLYDDLVSHENGLALPRGEITKYAFVLCPLAEIAGQMRHPVNGASYAELWRAFALKGTSQVIWPVNFQWRTDFKIQANRKMTDKNISTQEKWDTIYSSAEKQPKMASEVLRENAHLLPTSGKALDFACGLGANALLLAAQGLETHAWDISEVAVTRLEEEATARGLHIHAEARDLVAQPPEPESFDVIVSCHFLERPLNPHLLAALRPGGLLFYQTFTLERVDGAGPQNPEFRLHENELLTMFPGLRVLVYREEGLVGDTQRGFRSRAMLVVQKSS